MSDDKVYTVVTTGTTTKDSTTYYPYKYNNNVSNNLGYWWYSTPEYIYLYQVKCPKRGCKANNWLQLDRVTPCTKCGAKLKAVSDKVDFEIPITV